MKSGFTLEIGASDPQVSLVQLRQFPSAAAQVITSVCWDTDIACETQQPGVGEDPYDLLLP